MRPSSPLLDSVRDQFEGQDQMAKAGENMTFFNLGITYEEASMASSRGLNIKEAHDASAVFPPSPFGGSLRSYTKKCAVASNKILSLI
jgi:hypothetical protein